MIYQLFRVVLSMLFCNAVERLILQRGTLREAYESIYRLQGYYNQSFPCGIRKGVVFARDYNLSR